MALTVAQLVARLSADTSGFYKGMAVANASMVRTGGIIGRVAAGAGLATVAMGYMAIRSAGDFQQSMNILQAVSGATTGQLAKMQQKAIDLGADLKLPNTSAKDAADAMVELSKGGLSVNQILTASRGTIQLSLAANMDLADSAQVVARSLKAFNLGGNQATVVANLLAAGANKSTAEISDLTMGIQNASGQFTGAGYNIQTLVVALSELADKGLAGSLGGTALKVMMQRLESPTTKAAAEMHTLGVSVADAHGNIRPLPVLIGQFQRGLQNLSPIQKQQALNTIFGARANAAMLKLVDAGTGGWAKYSKAIVGNNAAQKMAEARTKGFNGAIQGIMSAVETFAIIIGLRLLPSATRAAHAIAMFVERLNAKAIGDFIVGIGSLVGSIIGFIVHSTTALSIIGGLVAAFASFKIIIGVIQMMKDLRLAIIAMNASMMANPFVLIAAAIIAVGVGLFILYQRSATARRVMNDIASFLKGTFGPALDWVKGKIGQLAAWVGQKFSEIRNWVHQHSTQIKADLSLIWNGIVGLIRADLAIITGIFHVVWPALKVYLQGVWDEIKIVVSGGIHIIRDVINIVMGLIHGDWGRAWRGLKNLVSDVFDTIKSLVHNALATLAKTAYTLAVSVGKAIWEGIKAGIGDLKSNLGGFLKDHIGGAINIAQALIQAHSPSKVTADKIGKPIADGIIRGFLLGIADLPAKIKSSLQTALTAAQQMVSTRLQQMQSEFSRFSSYVDTAFDAISQAHLTPSAKLLEGLTSAHDQAQLQDALDTANKSVKDASDQLDAANAATYDSEQARNDAIIAAQQALNDAVAQKKEAEYQIRIAALAKEAAEERKQYDARRALQKQHLDDMLADLEAKMAKHPERAAYWQKKILATLGKYGVNYKQSGQAMGDAFAVGMRESEKNIMEEVRHIAEMIARILKLHSPAAEGPLSDLDTWWSPFAHTLVKGLDSGPIRSAALGLAGQAQVSMVGGGAGGLIPALPGGASSAPTIVVPVTGNTFLTSERETLRALANALATVSPMSDSRLQVQP